MITLGWALVAVALCFAVAATVAQLRVSSAIRRQRRAEADPIDWPPTWAERIAANNGWPPVPSWAPHRHNVHCPSCGRFAAKRTDLGHALECNVHGLFVYMPEVWI